MVTKDVLVSILDAAKIKEKEIQQEHVKLLLTDGQYAEQIAKIRGQIILLEVLIEIADA